MDRHRLRKTITVIYYILVGILLARVLLSWIPALQVGPVGAIVYALTDPVLAPLKSIIPPMGGFDFTVIIVWFALQFIYRKIMDRI